MNNKKLYRTEDNKMLAGVCGGVAEYFNLDPTLVRVLWVAVSLFAGAGVILYIVMAIILWLKLDSNDLKLFTAVIVAIFLAVPYLQSQARSSFKHAGKMAQKAGKESEPHA